jgi:hypothetical protein
MMDFGYVPTALFIVIIVSVSRDLFPGYFLISIVEVLATFMH